MHIRRFAVVALSACGLWAQTFTGRLTDTVSDTSGAAITGAAVRLYNPPRGFSRTPPSQRAGANTISPTSRSVSIPSPCRSADSKPRRWTKSRLQFQGLPTPRCSWGSCLGLRVCEQIA
jgi:hypothetical protein